MGTCKSIVIENDGQETWAELSKIENWETAEVKDLLAMIREKGIVGIGGKFSYTCKIKPSCRY